MSDLTHTAPDVNFVAIFSTHLRDDKYFKAASDLTYRMSITNVIKSGNAIGSMSVGGQLYLTLLKIPGTELYYTGMGEMKTSLPLRRYELFTPANAATILSFRAKYQEGDLNFMDYEHWCNYIPDAKELHDAHAAVGMGLLNQSAMKLLKVGTSSSPAGVANFSDMVVPTTSSSGAGTDRLLASNAVIIDNAGNAGSANSSARKVPINSSKGKAARSTTTSSVPPPTRSRSIIPSLVKGTKDYGVVNIGTRQFYLLEVEDCFFIRFDQLSRTAVYVPRGVGEDDAIASSILIRITTVKF
jgi:hypothetical protein